MNRFLEEYLKHAALNLGQAARDIRFFSYHPSVDRIAKEGSRRHRLRSVQKRTLSLASNLAFTVLPPHLHHSKAERKAMLVGSHLEWFLFGFKPWAYPQPKKKKRVSR